MRSFVVALAVAVLGALPASAEPASKVFINGRATPVYFNDGDSFKPMAGPYKGSQSRLAGYNTLESFGPVHSWGGWSEKEMWVIAKLATKHAQKGVWHCETDGKKDGYGRLLMMCKDLAKSHIENGFAMAMSVNEDPADPELVAAQAEAIKNKRGMWASRATCCRRCTPPARAAARTARPTTASSPPSMATPRSGSTTTTTRSVSACAA
jgi:endonuclease YncB( thermonuclease family)